MDSKCPLYINKCILLVHKSSTKCHLGWANERGSTLKAKPKNKIRLFETYLPTSLFPYLPTTYLQNPTYKNLPTTYLPTYLINFLKKVNGFFLIATCHHIIDIHKWTCAKSDSYFIG